MFINERLFTIQAFTIAKVHFISYLIAAWRKINQWICDQRGGESQQKMNCGPTATFTC